MEAVAKRQIETVLQRKDVRATGMAILHAEGVSLSFGGQRVLDRLGLCIRTGDVLLLRGENGSGKTTLLNVMSGFIRPEQGTIRMHLHGQDINAISASPERLARSGLGRLWQDIRLFATMPVLDNVLAASPELVGKTALECIATWPLLRRQERIARERALYNLHLVGMADRAASSGDMLSVGQMKRVALARLLQAEADLWLLDEPLAGLDTDSANDLLELLGRLNDDHRKTFLIVEHQHERMAPICDRTLFLSDGRLQEEPKA